MIDLVLSSRRARSRAGAGCGLRQPSNTSTHAQGASRTEQAQHQSDTLATSPSMPAAIAQHPIEPWPQHYRPALQAQHHRPSTTGSALQAQRSRTEQPSTRSGNWERGDGRHSPALVAESQTGSRDHAGHHGLRSEGPERPTHRPPRRYHLPRMLGESTPSTRTML